MQACSHQGWEQGSPLRLRHGEQPALHPNRAIRRALPCARPTSIPLSRSPRPLGFVKTPASRKQGCTSKQHPPCGCIINLAVSATSASPPVQSPFWPGGSHALSTGKATQTPSHHAKHAVPLACPTLFALPASSAPSASSAFRKHPWDKPRPVDKQTDCHIGTVRCPHRHLHTPSVGKPALPASRPLAHSRAPRQWLRWRPTTSGCSIIVHGGLFCSPQASQIPAVSLAP